MQGIDDRRSCLICSIYGFDFDLNLKEFETVDVRIAKKKS